jgi:hypothetical protein
MGKLFFRMYTQNVLDIVCEKINLEYTEIDNCFYIIKREKISAEIIFNYIKLFINDVIMEMVPFSLTVNYYKIIIGKEE